MITDEKKKESLLADITYVNHMYWQCDQFRETGYDVDTIQASIFVLLKRMIAEFEKIQNCDKK